MDQEKLIKRLMATFLEELAEHVESLNRDLLALEKDPGADRADLLQTLFRTAHSLKGAARSVNVELIEGACHQLEEILAAAQDGQRPLTSETFPLLFATADAIEEAGMRLREQQDLTRAPLAAILPRLEAAAAAVAASPRRPAVSRIEDRGSRIEEEEGSSILDPRSSIFDPPQPTAKEEPVPREGEPPTEPAGSGNTVRVAAEKLDAFLARSGELLVARRRVESRTADLTALCELAGRWVAEWRGVEKALRKGLEHGSTMANGWRLPRRMTEVLGQTGDHLRQMHRELESLATTTAGDHRQLELAADALDDELRRVRMLPFAEACQGLERMVRDLARAGGKEVELVIEGGTVELDRSVLEGLKDPLRHLVRNAVDHGAEPADQRRQAGKPCQTRITVAAVLRGSQVEVIVVDDGRGIDLDGLRQQLQRKGLPEPLDERELARSIFLPGLSTARIITDVSGRGVGLDVVKSRVEALHGTVELAFTPGQRTCFTLAVPLTLTTLRALLVEVGGQVFALAGTNVQKLVRIAPGDLVSVAGRPMLSLGGTPLPVAALAGALGLPARERAAPAGRTPAVIVAAGDKRMVFMVDEFLAEQEIVIKNLGARIRRVRQFSGATVLPSGRIALVVNAANLIRAALSRAPAALAPVPDQAAQGVRRRILVADDSVTTRTLEKSILEAAGYDVSVAADGAAAWQALQERGTDLLVSDVEMPRMDGFALTAAVRASKRFHELPVVLVTARETEQDKARGIEVGADAYLIKSAFDQKSLLGTIAQLL